jgi:hypothetical protein
MRKRKKETKGRVMVGAASLQGLTTGPSILFFKINKLVK